MAVESVAVDSKQLAAEIMRDQPTGLFIDGQFVDALSGGKLPVEDPATGNMLCDVAEATAEDVDRAVRAARRAFDEGPWPMMNGPDRARILSKAAQLLTERREEFAVLETLDNGMPIATSRGEVDGVVENFEYYAGWCTKITGDMLGTVQPRTHFTFTQREPMGVIGAIIAWNFPLNNISWKLGAALAAGNCMVLKPAEQTPLSALRLASLFREAGLPDGVFNVISGYGPTAGAPLVVHPGVDKMGFTGEVATGRLVGRAAGEALKPVTLELGGKSPNIVFADADVGNVARGALQGAFHQGGQVCCAGSRIFVEASFYDDFAERLAEESRRHRQGHGLEPGTTLGPLISKEQTQRVRNYIEIGKSEGAEPVKGTPPLAPELGNGNFVPLTIFANVDDKARIAQEEVFGPVAVLLPFKEIDEVLVRANATPFGLAAGVWTSDLRKAFKAIQKLRAGTVWVNGYNVFDPSAPFGGYKESGHGRELGKAGLEAVMQTKTVWIRWNG